MPGTRAKFGLIMVAVVSLIGFLAVVPVVGFVAVWAGKTGRGWLALLICVPAMLGGLMVLTMDLSRGSFVFRNFIWLMTVQLAGTFIAYSIGRKRALSSDGDPKDFS